MTHRDQSLHAPLLRALGEAALALCAEKSWVDVGLLSLCQEAGQSLSACAEAGITRFSVAEYLDQKLDRAMLEAVADIEAEAPSRDRLFDVIMARFDAMQDQRAAWVSILEADAQEPAASVARAARRLRTAAWALEAIGISTDSLKAAARVMGLARRLRKIEALWLKDDADLSKTMAGLDQTLRESEDWLERGEKLSEFFKSGSLRRTRSKAADAHSPEDPPA
jgi:ubiquinone biosynthesis protein COQ9